MSGQEDSIFLAAFLLQVLLVSMLVSLFLSSCMLSWFHHAERGEQQWSWLFKCDSRCWCLCASYQCMHDCTRSDTPSLLEISSFFQYPYVSSLCSTFLFSIWSLHNLYLGSFSNSHNLSSLNCSSTILLVGDIMQKWKTTLESPLLLVVVVAVEVAVSSISPILRWPFLWVTWCAIHPWLEVALK